MIPKMAIEQANRTYMDASRSAWEQYLKDMRAAYGVYLSTYDSAERALKASKIVATKTRESQLASAYSVYKRSTTTTERQTWRNYEDSKLVIEAEFDKVMDHAKTTFEEVTTRAEEEFRRAKETIQQTYTEAVMAALDSFKEAHP